MPLVCEQCGRRLWFGTCCLRPFCRACNPDASHLMDCESFFPAVRMMPPFLMDNGRRPPGVFDRLPHPVWCMCRYISGERFTLVSYFNVEDQHYYHRDHGIRFVTHLFRRGSPTRWVWWVELTFTVLHRSPCIDISWKLHLSDEFTSTC
jgi:hypothetical protein